MLRDVLSTCLVRILFFISSCKARVHSCTLYIDIVVPELGVLVANTLGRMHALIEIPEFDKKPLLWDSINKWLTLGTPHHTTPQHNTTKNVHVVPKDFDHVKNKAHVERYLAMQIDLEAEAISLKEKLEKLNSPIVFCHNDINPGNIIYHEQAKSVLLIDYVRYLSLLFLSVLFFLCIHIS